MIWTNIVIAERSKFRLGTAAAFGDNDPGEAMKPQTTEESMESQTTEEAMASSSTEDATASQPSVAMRSQKTDSMTSQNTRSNHEGAN